jgi:hypothetical protein
MHTYKTADIKKLKREVFFKYKFHLATIFLIFFIFSFGIYRSIKLIEYTENIEINYQTVNKNKDWERSIHSSDTTNRDDHFRSRERISERDMNRQNERDMFSRSPRQSRRNF